jgi:uncharacterized membrane protein
MGKNKRRLECYPINADEKATYATMAVILILGLLMAIPPILPQRVVEPFSELGLLGPNLKLGDYPNEVTVGSPINLYLYHGNHEGHVQFYRTKIKVADQSMNISETIEYPSPEVAFYDLVLRDGMNQTTPITMTLDEPGINQRIIFELHKLDSETGKFAYSGVWVQLWLNISRPF